MIIRDAIDSDIRDIVQLSKSSEYINLNEKHLERYLRDPVHKVLIVEVDCKLCVVLIFAMILPEIDIIDLVVSEQYRRSGLGGTIIAHLIDIAKQNNVDRITLDLHSENVEAFGFYQKCGFSVAGTRKNYYQIPAIADALVMELLLN